ncbi:hypothetical protein BHE74_00013940 [Ensete ventricosum]|nr:hypothetical protein BHE74_00013940 [Ensete ventricosum]
MTSAGAAASASFVSSSLCRSRASAATAAVDGSSRSSNCFPYSLLFCCSFLLQQLPSPRSFATPLPSSPGEILLSAAVARQHRRLLPRQSTPTLSVLHSTAQRQLMLYPFCYACPVPDLLSAMLAPSFSARLTWLSKSTVVRPSPQLTT